MRSKILIALALLFLLLPLASCGKTETPPPTTAPTEVAVAPTATPEPTLAATPTEEPPTETVAPTEEPSMPTPTSPPPEEETAIFEASACPFNLAAGQVEGETVECGYLLVPENRADPNSATIRLAVAIFRHPDGAPEPDPIVYLEGGPGGSALEFIDLTFEEVYEPMWEANRDIVVFDQRGVGFSEPALDCPEVVELTRELLDYELDGRALTDQEISNLILERLLDCAEDLSQVADLSAYNTAANAADVEALRQALAYDQVNLWGISYGTRLALEVMRDYPEGLRSVVLDSVYPPDVDLNVSAAANADRAFDTLFDGCAADGACNAAYPDLRAVFSDTVERLNEAPASIEIINPLTGERYDALLKGADLQAFTFEFLYQAGIITSLPEIIYDASEGDYNLIALIAGALIAQQEVMSQGMQMSVQCHEEFPFSSVEELEEALAAYPELADLFEDAVVGGLGYEVCESWDSGIADAVENQPVASEIPTLILAGQYDPITPPAWGRLAAETLENANFFEYPGIGHGASVSHECPTSMAAAFFKDPNGAPDDACMAQMSGPEFAVPGGEVEAVELEPFVDEEMGIAGVRPVGWEEISPGIYTRAESALDAATLLMQAGPFAAEDLVSLLSLQLGLDEEPESTGEREANGLTWMIYSFEFRGLAMDIAVAEGERIALMVLLQSDPDERDALYDSVFLPTVDALVQAP